MQEHSHSSLDNRSRLGYRLECWNGFRSHITADLIISLHWTDGTTDSDLHSAQLEIQVQSYLNLNHLQQYFIFIYSMIVIIVVVVYHLCRYTQVYIIYRCTLLWCVLSV